MKKIIQLTALMFLFISFVAQADVNFTLTNKSASPISIMAYVDNNLLVLNYQTMQFLNNIKALKPEETFSIAIENGKFDLIINDIGQNKKQYKYETSPTANNKNKILIWDGSQLYPASDKHNIMGIIKTKTTISNNVSIGELFRTE